MSPKELRNRTSRMRRFFLLDRPIHRRDAVRRSIFSSLVRSRGFEQHANLEQMKHVV